jgi:hypothetical protein
VCELCFDEGAFIELLGIAVEFFVGFYCFEVK